MLREAGFGDSRAHGLGETQQTLILATF